MDRARVAQALGGGLVNRDISGLLAPLVAIVLLAFVVTQTLGALKTTGVFVGTTPAVVVAPDDPFVSLDRRLGDPRVAADGLALRDPFAFGSTPAVARPPRPGPRIPVVVPPPAQPVLTAIVYDAEPRALVRWKGKEWTIRAGGLFDEFQVVSIGRDQVTLTRGGETIVLQRKPQGE